MRFPRSNSKPYELPSKEAVLRSKTDPTKSFWRGEKALWSTLYNSGKIVLGGSDTAGIDAILELLDSLGAEEVERKVKESPPSGSHRKPDRHGRGRQGRILRPPRRGRGPRDA